jgi:hypothetical protein
MSDVDVRMEGKNSSCATFHAGTRFFLALGGAGRSYLGSDGGVLLGRSEM